MNGRARWFMLLLIGVGLVIPPPGWGGIFQCTRANGEKYFTDKPCKAGYDTRTLAADPARRPAGTERIPLLPGKVRGQYLVEVEVNGSGPFRFQIDTGANVVLLSREILEALEREGRIGEADRLGSDLVTLATGSQARLERVRLARVGLGSRRVDDILAFVGEAGINPLLGTSVLEQLGQWRIDHANRQLILGTGGGGDAAQATPPQRETVVRECWQRQEEIVAFDGKVEGLKRAEREEGERLKGLLEELQGRAEALQAARGEVIRTSNASVRAWNARAEELQREQQRLQGLQERFQANSRQRKARFEAYVKEAKEAMAHFNQACPGQLYQSRSGEWQVFPAYKVGSVQ